MLNILPSTALQWGTLLVIVLTAIYLYFKIAFTYWEKRGVPTLKPTIPFGNFGTIFFRRTNPADMIVNLYNGFEGEKVGGIYRMANPALLLRDPDVIKDVLIKHFDSFYSRGNNSNIKAEPLQGHLFALSGSKWRNLRIKMTPTFTSGKMKMMFGTFVDCGKELQICLKKTTDSSPVVEIKDILARYGTDVIASCAFGIQCNCLQNPDAEFRNWGRRIFKPSFITMFFRLLTLIFPPLIRVLRVSFLPQDVSNYFRTMVRETVEYREKNDIKRNDFMQLLIQLKNKTLGGTEKEDPALKDLDIDDLKSNKPFEVTMDVLAAQAFVFFLAGFETSSTTMTFCLYELSINQDIQQRVREEIDAVLGKHGGQLTYENIQEMEYLDKVVSETLRKHPAVPFIERHCTKTTKIDGVNAPIEKGTSIMIPIKGLHRDPKYYPDPERFDPERFSEEEKRKRPHFCYLPFGEGPRICIGMRFGLMQIKVGLVNILSNYEVYLPEKTELPPNTDPRSLMSSPLGGMWLKIVNRSDIH